MGDGAHGAVPEGADVRRLGGGLAWALLAALPLVCGIPAVGAAGPATLTVHLLGGSVRTALRLQPGFATVVRADRRIDTVAIGDPRLVTATTVKRGQDVYDLVLQPQTTTGVTNMIVWFGEATSIWDLTIGPGQRTADIVYVVTNPPATSHPASSPPPPTPSQAQAAPAGPQTPTTNTPSPAAEPGPGAAAAPLPRAGAPPEKPQPSTEPAQYLEAQQTLREAAGVFQLFRGRGGIKIGYRITNHSAIDFSVKPNGVLIRINGRLVPFGMSRDNADRDRPAVLPSGLTEAGTISAPAKAPRQVEVIFSVFPIDEGQGPSRTVPATFQLVFVGVDRLPTSSNP